MLGVTLEGMGNSAKERLFKTCLFCGNLYKVQCKARLKRSKFCSRSCRQKHRYENEQGFAERIRKLTKTGGRPDTIAPRFCESCGVKYVPTSTKQRWCTTCNPGGKWTGRLQRYGVSEPIWNSMLASQGGNCAICEKTPTVVDHDHKTGLVRGLLCYSCNLKLSGIDDSEWLKKARSYLAFFQ